MRPLIKCINGIYYADYSDSLFPTKLEDDELLSFKEVLHQLKKYALECNLKIAINGKIY